MTKFESGILGSTSTLLEIKSVFGQNEANSCPANWGKDTSLRNYRLENGKYESWVTKPIRHKKKKKKYFHFSV